MMVFGLSALALTLVFIILAAYSFTVERRYLKKHRLTDEQREILRSLDSWED